MISREKCIMLGTLVKTHGVYGSLLLRGYGREIQKIKGPGSVFIAIDGLLVPFFMSSIREKTENEFIIDLEDVDTAEKAGPLKGYNVFITDSSTSGVKPLNAGKDIAGYTVTDNNSGFTGEASGILDMAGNTLLKVIKEGHEYLVPFHEDIILKINHREKKIIIAAPEGLFDL